MTESITGRTIGGKYLVTSHLRSTRMGDFWLARRSDDQELVALKLLDPTLFNELEAISRFEREARVVGQLRHPCLLSLIDHGRTDDGIPYIVTEHIPGELLSDVIEESDHLAPERAARIAARVALALNHAHDQGIIHRDLQPANILVTPEGDDADGVRVLEFGLARIAQSDTGGDEASLTAVGVRIGSPAYMAPEYIEEYSLDFRADLYSLGIVLYEMLVGTPPFTGRPYKILNMHINEPVPKPSAGAAGIPPALDALVLQLCEKDKGKRPKSGKAVADALEAIFATSFVPQPAHRKGATPTPQRAATSAPMATAPDRDPVLQRFTSAQVRSVQRRTAVALPNRADCLVVEDVGKWSVFGDNGVKPGWLLELPDEPRTGLRPTEFWREYVASRRYRLTAPDGSEQVEIVASSIEPGAAVHRTVEHVRKFFDPLEPDAGALFELWQQGAWEDLERLSRRVISGSRGPLNSGIFSRLFGGGESRKLENHPALMFLGAALFETGKEKEGADLVQEYLTSYGTQWPARYQAVALLYDGMKARRMNRDKIALERWQSGLEIEPLERLVAGIEQLTGERRNPTPWLAQKFPDYNIEVYGGREEVRLTDTLDSLDGSQLLAVVMLGGFRGNAEYNELMSRWLAYVTWFADFLPEVHVITTRPERETDRPEFYAAEDAAKRAGVKIHVLNDSNAWVQRKVKISRVPTVFLVNKWGYVAHEGLVQPPAMWDALRRNAVMRLRALSQQT